jgi:hypothetical protein
MKHTTIAIVIITLCCFPCLHVYSQPPDANLTSSGNARRQYHTTSIAGQPVRMDGIIDEEAWNTVEWSGDFLQHEPNQGTAPKEQTQFKITHDEKYLYLAYRAFDQSPDSIIERLSRRDEFPGDWVEVNIDSYHDFRTGFSFTLSASGVKGDEFISNNGNFWDVSWNPIWEAATNIDELGWTAEVRIPFSQLRYGNQAEPVWGLQVQRRIFRFEERSSWQFIPKSSGGWVSEFGELHGLRDLPTNTQIELAPYVVAQTERFAAEPGNPYADGSRSKVTAGLDGKFSITRDIILDFTVNPDFGQVEADPGSIRLDGYEVFFEERRPFFVESRNLFDYEITNAITGGSQNSDVLFYSRRIGGSPHGYPPLSEGEYADVPSFTSILGAAKLSGKTKKGLSIGILECLTNKEFATVSNGSDERKVTVEPFTNYFVGRAIKDFSKGNTIIGGLLTAVNRGDELPLLHKAAYSGVIDFVHYWKNRWYNVSANLILSRVEGTADAIQRTQTSFVHLLQRRDADHVNYDPTRTSLMGTGGTLKVAKFGGKQNEQGGTMKFESGVTWRSPELELNDIGFLSAADEITHFTWTAYQIQQETKLFRSAEFNYNHWFRWDFSGKFLYNEYNVNSNAWLKNYWRVSGGFNYNPYDISNNALRGTTALRRPPGYGVNLSVQSDSRKKVNLRLNYSGGAAYQQAVTFRGFYGGISVQPIDAMQFSISPSYERSTRKQDQFVANIPYAGGVRSIVSRVERRSISLATRFNYYITPELSLQFYGEPFIFRAEFDNYGYVVDPLNKVYENRFHAFTPDEITFNGITASIDENGDAVEDYSFNTPDLNYIQFRSNLVMRWEYVPGSEVFLVWSQGVLPDAYGDFGTPLFRSLFDNVFDAQPHNIFLVKLSYRFVK